MLIFSDIVFLSASVLVFVFALRCQLNLAMATHLLSYLIFGLITHIVWRLQLGIDYPVAAYVNTHILSFFVFTACAFAALNMKALNMRITRRIQGINPALISRILIIWLVFHIYLFIKYGKFGILDLQVSTGGTVELQAIDFAAMSLINSLFVGSMFVAFIRLGADSAFIRNLRVWSVVGLCIVVMASTGLAMGGFRRTILLLASATLVSKFFASKGNVHVSLRKSFATLLLAAIVVGGFSWYFNNIRNNAYNPAVITKLNSPQWAERWDGLILLLSPSVLAKLYSTDKAEKFALKLRNGPFDFLFNIVEKRFYEGHSTDGELLWHSFKQAMPRLLYPEKPTFDADYIVFSQLSVVPAQGFYLSSGRLTGMDYSGSVTAFLLADFGIPGVLLAVFIIVLSIGAASRVAVSGVGGPVMLIAYMGVLFELCSLIEGGLTSAFSSLRTLLIFFGLGIGLSLIRPASARRRRVRQAAALNTRKTVVSRHPLSGR